MVIYKKYIKSKEWMEKSRTFIKFVGCRCEECGTKNDLGCHHITYKNLGFESQDDIKVLCWKHHKAKHKNRPGYSKYGRKHTYCKGYKSILVDRHVRLNPKGIKRRKNGSFTRKYVGLTPGEAKLLGKKIRYVKC